MRSSVQRLWRRARAECQGHAAAEFALIFPLMMLLYVGGFEITQGLYAYRKLTVTARSVADLTSQYMSMTHNDITNIIGASTQVMAPFAVSKTTIVLSEITTTNTPGQATVTWSCASSNASARPPNSTITTDIPASPPGVPFVLAEVGYTFAPMGDGALIHPLHMGDHIYMLPRQSASISLTSC